jgi:dTDP-D-glucose 4,6-dehydratase
VEVDANQTPVVTKYRVLTKYDGSGSFIAYKVENNVHLVVNGTRYKIALDGDREVYKVRFNTLDVNTVDFSTTYVHGQLKENLFTNLRQYMMNQIVEKMVSCPNFNEIGSVVDDEDMGITMTPRSIESHLDLFADIVSSNNFIGVTGNPSTSDETKKFQEVYKNNLTDIDRSQIKNGKAYRYLKEEKIGTDGSARRYAPITASDTPRPNTAYGESKLKAEEFLRSQPDVPWVILRPTGVYGPRERDYFLMAKSIKQHIDFAVGYEPQEITFVYMMDVVQAVFLACERPASAVVHHAYFLTDGNSYHSRAFSDLLQKEMGTRWVLHVKAPLWFLRAVCTVNGAVARWMGKLTTLNMDKYHILAQRNWNCDIEPARRELGYEPQWNLKDGVRESVKWYKQAGWL